MKLNKLTAAIATAAIISSTNAVAKADLGGPSDVTIDGRFVHNYMDMERDLWQIGAVEDITQESESLGRTDARIGATGTLAEDLTFGLEIQFLDNEGNSNDTRVTDAVLNYAGFGVVNLRSGQYKTVNTALTTTELTDGQFQGVNGLMGMVHGLDQGVSRRNLGFGATANHSLADNVNLFWGIDFYRDANSEDSSYNFDSSGAKVNASEELEINWGASLRLGGLFQITDDLSLYGAINYFDVDGGENKFTTTGGGTFQGGDLTGDTGTSASPTGITTTVSPGFTGPGDEQAYDFTGYNLELGATFLGLTSIIEIADGEAEREGGQTSDADPLIKQKTEADGVLWQSSWICGGSRTITPNGLSAVNVEGDDGALEISLMAYQGDYEFRQTGVVSEEDGEAEGYGVAVNWYPTNGLKLGLSYHDSEVETEDVNGVKTSKDEKETISIFGQVTF